jgi:hypothetical protein
MRRAIKTVFPSEKNNMKNEKQYQRRKNFFVVGKNTASEEALYVYGSLRNGIMREILYYYSLRISLYLIWFITLTVL